MRADASSAGFDASIDWRSRLHGAPVVLRGLRMHAHGEWRLGIVNK